MSNLPLRKAAHLLYFLSGGIIKLSYDKNIFMLDTEFWRKYFKVYDVLNFCIPYREMIDALVKAVAPRFGEKILDAGGGTGNVAVELTKSGADVIVFDFSKEALEICEQKDSRINICFGDLTQKLPFSDNYFDKVVSNNAIYTITEDKRINVIREFWRVLKPGGKIIISNVKKEWRPLDIYIDHIKKDYKKSSLGSLLYRIIKMSLPTIKMFYYNSKITKEGLRGNYRFMKSGEQIKILEKSSFKNITEDILIYANQAILNSATK